MQTIPGVILLIASLPLLCSAFRHITTGSIYSSPKVLMMSIPPVVQRMPSCTALIDRRVFFTSVASSAASGLALIRYPGTVHAQDVASLSYISKDGAYQVTVPRGFEEKNKPVKTHLQEVTFKSREIKGFQIGVAVDPVKLEALEKFGPPAEVGRRVLAVERAKEGVFDAELLSAEARREEEGEGDPAVGPRTYYVLDYRTSSSRGETAYVVKIGVAGGRLYVLTAQFKQGDRAAAAAAVAEAVDSFRVNK